MVFFAKMREAAAQAAASAALTPAPGIALVMGPSAPVKVGNLAVMIQQGVLAPTRNNLSQTGVINEAQPIRILLLDSFRLLRSQPALSWQLRSATFWSIPTSRALSTSLRKTRRGQFCPLPFRGGRAQDTKWHVHEMGQIILCEEGVCRSQDSRAAPSSSSIRARRLMSRPA